MGSFRACSSALVLPRSLFRGGRNGKDAGPTAGDFHSRSSKTLRPADLSMIDYPRINSPWYGTDRVRYRI